MFGLMALNPLNYHLKPILSLLFQVHGKEHKVSYLKVTLCLTYWSHIVTLM